MHKCISNCMPRHYLMGTSVRAPCFDYVSNGEKPGPRVPPCQTEYMSITKVALKRHTGREKITA